MRSLPLLACAATLGLVLVGPPTALAQGQKPPSAAQQAQQDRMKSCNADATAKKLTGDARKQFMSDCLSGKTESGAKPPNSQQAKMQTCNKQASDQHLSGDARKQFMSSCLKG